VKEGGNFSFPNMPPHFVLGCNNHDDGRVVDISRVILIRAKLNNFEGPPPTTRSQLAENDLFSSRKRS